jgi:hypothetical protein
VNAFIEIIAQLVEAIPPGVWLQQHFFPFSTLSEPIGRLFDACIFRQSADGALGILWVEFEGVTDILVVPFRLARYNEDSDLITLTPWSLRDASSDSEFFEAWRVATHMRNPLPTAKNGVLKHRYCNGEPTLLALGIWSDSKYSLVRVESQDAFKIRRTLSRTHAESLEVEILEYLTQQTLFLNFPRLISVYDYSGQQVPRASVAISMKYLQNHGSLWQDLIARIQHARFPEKMRERSSRESWEYIIRKIETIGRLTGEFHRAMTYARDNAELTPESNTGEVRRKWIFELEHKLQTTLKQFEPVRQRFPGYFKLFDSLALTAEKLIQSVRSIHNLGLLIRTHGHLHLGQILIDGDSLFLLDYDNDSFDEPHFRRLKQPCLNDLASLILSLKYAWFMTERTSYAPTLEDFIDKESEFGKHVTTTKSHFSEPCSYAPQLAYLEATLVKYYKNAIFEDPASTELVPLAEKDFEALFTFCFFTRLLKETLRDFTAGNPRCKISLRILREFLADPDVDSP